MKTLHQRGYLHPHVHCSTVYNNQDTETTEVVVCIYIKKMELLLFSHKKEGNPIICDSMDEPQGHYFK